MVLAAGFCRPAAPAGAAPPPPEATGAKAAETTTNRTPDDDVIMRRERYFYSSFARRDPFASLISGSFAATTGNDLLDIGEISLVGVVWGEDDKFAVVQDVRKHVHVLRVGDRVVNGTVVKVTKTSLTVQHYFFGETANVTIQMSQGEGSNETP
jgi:hypothetical protein